MKNKIMKKTEKKGFTLIELVVVIAIMTLLALIMVPNLTSYLNKADDSKVASNSKTIHTAAELVKQTSGSLDKIQIVNLSNNDKVSIDVVEDSDKVYGTYYVEQHGDKIIVKHVDKTDKLHTFPTLDSNSNNSGDIDENPTESIYIAKDEDFSGITNGGFKYIGSEKIIEIPHTIKGVPVTSYYEMFKNSGVSKVVSTNTNITDMRFMFYASTSDSLDLSSFNTSKVKDMSWMFDGSQATSLDLSSFDTSNVTGMRQMFAYNKATSLNLSSFNTSNVIDMNYMFYSSQAMSLNLTSFNTEKVTDMSWLFQSSRATTLDLTSFNTSNVTNMSQMFQDSQVILLDLSSFNISKVTDTSKMFFGSKATTGYASTSSDVIKFNTSSDKPTGLTFRLK